jgi:putative addiction module component (TIGR02574 family)
MGIVHQELTSRTLERRRVVEYTEGMSTPQLSEILRMSISERLRLVQDIWDSIAEFPEALPLTEAQRRLLDERLEEHSRNPGAGSPWPEVKARLLASR